MVELVSLLPKKPMSSKEFRKHVEAQEPDFFHTPYQLACQLGLYYEGKELALVVEGRVLLISELQPEGKNRMTTRDYRNGAGRNIEGKVLC